MLIPFKPRPEFDIYRVDYIRARLDEDGYDINHQQVADKFFEFEAELPGLG